MKTEVRVSALQIALLGDQTHLNAVFFAPLCRAVGEIWFHHRDQLRMADLFVIVAPYFQPLVHRARGVRSGRSGVFRADQAGWPSAENMIFPPGVPTCESLRLW